MGKSEPVLHRAIRSAAMTATLLSHEADIDAKDAYGRLLSNVLLQLEQSISCIKYWRTGST